MSLGTQGPHRGAYCDLRQLQERFGGLSEREFNKLRANQRLGLRHSEFRKLLGKYGQIVAVRIDSASGDPIASITLNVPPDFPCSINIQHVRDTLATAIEAARVDVR